MKRNLKANPEAFELVKLWRVVAECVCGIAAVALVTFVCFRWHVHLPTPSCSYLMVIMLLALYGSLLSSIIVSLIAVGCLDYYFLPPLFSLDLTDPRDLVAAGSFVITAVVVSGLVSRVRSLGEKKLQKIESYLSEAQQLSRTGSFGWNVTTGELIWSDETFRIFQCDPATRPTVEFALQCVHPEDVGFVKQTMERVSREGKDFELEHRLLMPDGSVKYLWVVARATWTQTRILEFVGAVMDITEKKKTEMALRSSEEKLEEAQRIAHVGYWERDLNLDIISWSDETYRIFGLPLQERMLRLSELVNYIHPDDREIMQRGVDKALKGECRYDVEYRVIRPNGDIRFVHSSGDVVKDESGLPRRMFGTIQDITDQMRAKAALSASERLARSQLEALKSTLGALATESNPENLPRHVMAKLLSQINAHSATVWERDGDMLNLMGIVEGGRFKTRGEPGNFQASMPIAAPAPPLWCEGILTAEHVVIDEFHQEPSRIILADGRTALWHAADLPDPFPCLKAHLTAQGVHGLLIVPLIYGAKIAGIIGIRFSGKREFAGNEIELTKVLAHQAMLAIQLMRLSQQNRKAVILAERNRVAQELHDTLLQGFIGVGMRLDAVTNSLPPSLAATKEQIQKILKQSDEYLGEARRAVWQLRSPFLKGTVDFSEALKQASERALQGTGISLHFETYGGVFKLGLDIEDNFLRICEEAVANAMKHAHCTEVAVALEYSPKELRLRIRDNGKGFDPDGPEISKSGHFGLVGIRERTKRLAGDLSLNSQKGKGTEILVTVYPPAEA